MAAGESRPFRRGERAYNLTGDHLLIYIGEGLGNLDYKDAIELSIVKRTASGYRQLGNIFWHLRLLPKKLAGNGKPLRPPGQVKITLTNVSTAATRQPVMQIWLHI